MSQIPRRATTLSMSQPPKVRKTPTVSPTASQPIVTKRQQQEATDIPVKTIEVETPIVIEDTDFGDSMENHNLVQVLSSVEEKNGLTQKNSEAKTPTNEQKKSVKESPAGSPTTNGSGKASKRSKAKRSFANDGVQDVAVDDTQSSSTSIRSSVDSSAPVEMESLLIPEDEDLVESPSEKSVSSYDSPRPNKTPGGTKVVRLTKGMRLSPFRKVDQAALDNVSTIVNLSTVSEQSIENNLDSPVVPSATETKNGATPDAQGDTEATNNSDASGASSRRITARRTYASNRPLREMSFRNATREAYRKNGTGTPSEENSNEEAVNDSVNATVGSELGLHMDDLPETPAVGQKRRRDSSDAEDDAAPEPKKSLFQTYCAIM